MKIVADEGISHAGEAFKDFGELILLPGREIRNSHLFDADALLTRSVTNVNEELLKGTKVNFVGTATIGWDHVDRSYLASEKIYFSSAAGCNSDAVTEYVFAAIFNIAAKQKLNVEKLKIGIVGAGNIGSRVAKISELLGMRIVLNDPPLKRKTGSEVYRPLEEIYDCDIITLHVPLNTEGQDKTVHLFNKFNLQRLKNNSIFINSSRGAVADNNDLVSAIREKNLIAVIDVWENEPSLNKELLNLTHIATPHIAGYSYEGKINGTVMIYKELCRFAGYDPGWKYSPPEYVKEKLKSLPGSLPSEKIDGVIKQVYDINKDSINLKKALNMSSNEIPSYFDLLRKNYNLRKEFFNYSFIPSENPEVNHALRSLKFRN